ncbi:MAG: S8 family peptidase [Bacteroidia bacterium]|jgi:subtilisin family serine protease
MQKHLFIAGLIATSSIFAQKKLPDNWILMDPQSDKVYGAGVEKAYEKLKDKKGKTVIVAVIDSGVDTDHEDLKDVIWTNTGEIPDNGVDDDKNGYVDDIHGWSFLGGKNGDINHEASELARMYHRMNKKFSTADTNNLKGSDATEFAEFKTIRNEYLTELAKDEQELQSIDMIYDFLIKVKRQNNGSLTKATVANYATEDKREKQLKKFIKLASAFGVKPEELEGQLKEGKEYLENNVKYNKLNTDSIRQVVVGDDVNNATERYYGCNRVKGPDALHGTHVSGIIAAMRNNNVGIKGIANNVKIMPVRAVPNGDERDKDIANAIRYAVDNGATIINMSFGKYYSPDKKIVDEAIQYALSKDVLLIHAAGNESKNVDSALSYPNRELSGGITAPNWIEVGANGYKKGKNIIGTFSNYGRQRVDLFAPGVDIYSTVPDNKYINESGTSMASPSTAGVAAIIRSYFPELKAEEVKVLLMKTVVPYKKKVLIPGSTRKKTKVTELCISGGFVNADRAVSELLKKK